jgi:histidinol phosphatase-like enzyme
MKQEGRESHKVKSLVCREQRTCSLKLLPDKLKIPLREQVGPLSLVVCRVSLFPTSPFASANADTFYFHYLLTATNAYAQLGFAAAAVSTPPNVFITSDLCSKGKPDPEPYLLGAKHLKVDIARCLVVEDAPAGVESGKRAGAKVLGLKTTHAGSQMWRRGADYVVQDLSKVKARWEGSKLFLDIDSEEAPASA